MSTGLQRSPGSVCVPAGVQVLEQLLGKILSQMPLLLRMLDNIALLDMLLAFFQAVTGTALQAC